MNVASWNKRYRAIWISDIHLGVRACKADHLLDFLRWNESDYLYLVGDIVDGWSLRKTWYWNPSFDEVIRRFLHKARNGTEVYYIPGNHDEAARNYCELEFAGIKIREEAIHETADGKRLLILHGDEFDGVVRYAKQLSLLGDTAYRFALVLNHWFNWARRKLGYPYWSLSAYLKHTVKNAVEYVSNFEDALAEQAREREVDGVICGHIHHAEIRDIGGIIYCNDGDWVESCTALVEHFDGRLEIVRWAEVTQEMQMSYAR